MTKHRPVSSGIKAGVGLPYLHQKHKTWYIRLFVCPAQFSRGRVVKG